MTKCSGIDDTFMNHRDVNTVIFACTSAYFNGPALDRVRDLYQKSKGKFHGVIATDAVTHTQKFLKENKDWYTELSVAPIFARQIYRYSQGLPFDQ